MTPSREKQTWSEVNVCQLSAMNKDQKLKISNVWTVDEFTPVDTTCSLVTTELRLG